MGHVLVLPLKQVVLGTLFVLQLKNVYLGNVKHLVVLMDLLLRIILVSVAGLNAR